MIDARRFCQRQRHVAAPGRPAVAASVVRGQTSTLIELPPGLQIAVKLYWTVARLHADTLSRLTRAVRAVAIRELQ